MAPGGPIQLQEAFARRDPACGQIVATETPGPHAEPAEIFIGIAGVRKLPIQNGAQPFRTNDEIAHPKVAMDERRSLERRRMEAQPPQTELKRRMALAARVEVALERCHQVECALWRT